MNLQIFDKLKTWKQTIIDNMKAARPFSLYAFVITQAGTGNPTATTLFSDLAPMVAVTPVVPAFVRTGAGVYTLTITGAFPAAAKVPKIAGIIDAATGSRYSIEYTSANVVTIRTFIADGTATDALLTGKLLELKVWD